MFLFSKKEIPSTDPDTENVDELEDDSTEEHPLAEIVRFSIIAILIVIPIRMLVAQPFIVSGASMDDTFHSGEYLIVEQISYYLDDPNRGDVIVFRYPKDPNKFFIKRIIGIPGDEVTIEDGRVTIDNDSFSEEYVLDEPYAKEMNPAPTLTEKLGDREYFVMGDNRNNSSDSREWGILQKERIEGRALVRLFPPSRLDYLPGAFSLDGPTEDSAEVEVSSN